MLEIEEYIKKYFEEKNYNMNFEEFLTYGTKKYVAILSTNDYMMSIDILDDFTCDVIILRIEDEVSFYIVTVYCENIKELQYEIKMSIERLNFIQKKHYRKV